MRREVSLLLCPGAGVGQYALVHADFAISVVDEEEAALGLGLFAQYRAAQEEPPHGG